ncbi:hypothetical protein pb186bvf_020444 [Paramecium bursaria]
MHSIGYYIDRRLTTRQFIKAQMFIDQLIMGNPKQHINLDQQWHHNADQLMQFEEYSLNSTYVLQVFLEYWIKLVRENQLDKLYEQILNHLPSIHINLKLYSSILDEFVYNAKKLWKEDKQAIHLEKDSIYVDGRNLTMLFSLDHLNSRTLQQYKLQNNNYDNSYYYIGNLVLQVMEAKTEYHIFRVIRPHQEFYHHLMDSYVLSNMSDDYEDFKFQVRNQLNWQRKFEKPCQMFYKIVHSKYKRTKSIKKAAGKFKKFVKHNIKKNLK